MKEIAISPELVIIDNPIDLEDWLETIGLLNETYIWSIDIETTGLDPLTGKILTIGIGTGENHVVIIDNREDWLNKENIETLDSVLFKFEEHPTIIMQNGKFDLQFLIQAGFTHAHCHFDTMMAHYCLNEETGTHGLKQWAQELLGVEDWSKDVDYDNLNRMDTESLFRYQALDCIYTLQGYEIMKKRLEEEGATRAFYEVYMPAVNVFSGMELDGIPIDVGKLNELIDQAKPRIEQAEEKLTQAALDCGWDDDKYLESKGKARKADKGIPLFELLGVMPTERRVTFNPRSNDHLAYVAYTLLQTPKFKGRESCDKHAIERYRDSHTFWNALAEYREASSIFGSFLQGMQERLGSDGRLHPDFILHGTRTGRISCHNPNMQNLPRGSIVKDLILPDEGHVLVNADYKTLEVVVASALSGDDAMQRPFHEGIDFHGQTTDAIFERLLEPTKRAVNKKSLSILHQEVLKDPLISSIRAQTLKLAQEDKWDDVWKMVWKHLRNLSKAVTFGTMYGRGAKSLAENELQCSAIDAQIYVWNFFNKYKKYKAWLDKQFMDAKTKHFVQNLFGLKRRFPVINSENEFEVRNQAWNTPVQGTAAMICLKAVSEASEELAAHGYGRVLLTVHDSILASVITFDKGLPFYAAVNALRTAMTESVKLPNDVPLSVEFEYGSTYLKMKEYEGE